MTYHSNLSSSNFEEDISPKVSNNGEEKIRLADTTGNDNENSRPADINEQRSIIPNWIS